MTGGSSSGCGAATAAGLAPLSLGSDTNGSIRVPASLCGIFGLKPTYGRLGRSGPFPFVDSLDHLGPFARTARDLALAYDALQGPDPADHAARKDPLPRCCPASRDGVAGLRVGIAGGFFTDNAGPEAGAALARVTEALGAEARTVRRPRRRRRRPRRGLPHHQRRGRGLPPRPPPRPRRRLRPRHPRPLPRRRADPRRLGRARPARPPLVARADARGLPRGRPRHRPGDALHRPPDRAEDLRARRPHPAGPPEPRPPRPTLLGDRLPVATVPGLRARPTMPIGVQLVAAPWREDLCLRAAAWLEDAGLAVAHAPPAAAAAEAGRPADAIRRLPRGVGRVCMKISLPSEVLPVIYQ